MVAETGFEVGLGDAMRFRDYQELENIGVAQAVSGLGDDLALGGELEDGALFFSGGGAYAESGGEGVHGFLQERVVSLHVAAVIGLLVEEIAELAVGFRFARAKDAVDVENLLRVSR